jgi:hypothetical protein
LALPNLKLSLSMIKKHSKFKQLLITLKESGQQPLIQPLALIEATSFLGLKMAKKI